MKTKQDGGVETTTAYFCGKNRRMIDMREFQDLYAESKAKIWNSFDKWIKEGSGWRIESVQKVILKICKYKPVHGSIILHTMSKED